LSFPDVKSVDHPCLIHWLAQYDHRPHSLAHFSLSLFLFFFFPFPFFFFFVFIFFVLWGVQVTMLCGLSTSPLSLRLPAHGPWGFDCILPYSSAITPPGWHGGENVSPLNLLSFPGAEDGALIGQHGCDVKQGQASGHLDTTTMLSAPDLNLLTIQASPSCGKQDRWPSQQSMLGRFRVAPLRNPCHLPRTSCASSADCGVHPILTDRQRTAFPLKVPVTAAG
jgi:hypothetical protein